jgi:hypothetical protein
MKMISEILTRLALQWVFVQPQKIITALERSESPRTAIQETVDGSQLLNA